jgi:hypothetical protein
MSTAQGGWRGPNIVKNGLVLYLDAGSPNSYFPLSSGIICKDISGFGNNGTLINGVVYSSQNGGSFLFDGLDDYIQSTNNPSLQITNALTLSIWLKGDSSFNAGSLMCKSTQIFGNNIDKVYELGFLSSVMYFQFGNGTLVSNVFFSSSSVITNTWKQVVCTWDGTTNTNGIKMYYDGILVAQNTAASTVIQNPVNTPLLIGDGRRGAFRYKGDIGIVKIYNRSLSQAEVLKDYNESKVRFGI